MNSGWTKARLLPTRENADSGRARSSWRRWNGPISTIRQRTTRSVDHQVGALLPRGPGGRWLRRVCFPRIQAAAGCGGFPRFGDPPTARNTIHWRRGSPGLDAEHRASQRQPLTYNSTPSKIATTSSAAAIPIAAKSMPKEGVLLEAAFACAQVEAAHLGRRWRRCSSCAPTTPEAARTGEP